MASPGGVEVGRVSVRVVPDTSRLGTDLKVALDRIEAQTDLTISTSIDTARLDEQARAAVAQAQLAAGDLNIKTNVDTSQVREAEAALSGASSAANGFSASLSGVGSAATILGPALIPLVAVLAALGASLVAPLAIVGGGLTLFGVIAGFTIAETQKQLAVITQLQKKLSGLTKGTAEYAQVSAQLKAAQAALSPAQVKFEGALSNLKRAFDSIPKSIVLNPIIDGLNLLAQVIPLVTPILKSVSRVIDDLIGKFDKFARSAGFKDFVTAFAKQIGPDLRAFASIAGNVFAGLFGLFGAFNKQLSGSVLKGLENLTGKFANWGRTVGQSKGFRSFIDYVKRVGPIVSRTIGDIAGALGAIVTAAAPIGTAVLLAVDGLAKVIQKIPMPVLTALAGFFVLVSGLGVGSDIAAVAVAFVALYQNSKPLRRVLGDLGDFFKTQLLPIIEKAARQVIPALKAAFHDISQSIRQNKPFLETMGKLFLILASAVVVTGILAIVGAIRVMGKAIAGGITVYHTLADVVLSFVKFTILGFGLLAKTVLSAFGVIVDGAAAAFGWMPKIGGRVKAAQSAFHSFADNVSRSFDDAVKAVDRFQTVIDGTHGPKPFKVTVDDLNAVKQLEALQRFRIFDKSFKVTENIIERIVGPGGGIGRPAPNGGGTISPKSVAPPNIQGGSNGGGASAPRTSSGALVHADVIQVRDVDDLIRKSSNLLRSRAGGGVLLGARG